MKKKTPHAPAPRPAVDRTRHMLAAYYATLALCILFSFFPEYRVWGLNWWAYYPFWLKIVLVAVGAVAPPILLRVFRPSAAETTPDPGDNRRFWIIAGAVIAVSLVLFVVLRARMHFLGDGYLLLGLLARDHVVGRAWTAVGDLARSVVFDLLPGAADDRARLTFQLFSYVFGTATMIVLAFLARHLTTGTMRRVLVFVALATGGYALMFFGYVEMYPPFLFAIALYLLLALLIVQKRISLYWILLPLVLAGMSHIFAVALIAPTIYLFLHCSPLSRWYATVSAKSRRAMLFGVLILGFVAVMIMYMNVLYVRYSLVPIVANETTTDGYTFFSPAHLLDWVNLLFVLMPGLLVAALVLWGTRRRGSLDLFTRTVGITAAVSLVMTLMFNPNLSMPRDWDLFAFAGLPLVLFTTLLLIQQGRLAALALSVVLAVLVLLPRAGAQTSAQLSIPHFRTYAKLNPLMNRSGRFRLMQYYQQIRDTVTANAEEAEIKRIYPAYDYQFRSEYLLGRGLPHDALMLARQAIEADRRSFYGYIFAARASMAIGDLPGAKRYVEIANALNPGNVEGLQAWGGIQCAEGDFDRGLATLYRAREIKDSASQITNDIAQISLARGDMPTALKEIRRMVENPTTPARFFADLAPSLLQANNLQAARAVWQEAQRRNLDSATTSAFLAQFPQLAD